MEEITGDPATPALLLYEDSDVRKARFILPDHIHVVSTWGLLKGMERKGLVSSASDIWTALESAGRVPSRDDIDQAGVAAGRSTSW
jgi:hypothetical protein